MAYLFQRRSFDTFHPVREIQKIFLLFSAPSLGINEISAFKSRTRLLHTEIVTEVIPI
jgi:hypothetical protein